MALASITIALAAQQPAARPGAPALARALSAALAHLQADMAAVRSDRWRAKSELREQFNTDYASIRRNLTEAVPGLVDKVEQAPQDLGAAFRLYRDVEAVYAVAQRSSDLVTKYGSAEQAGAVDSGLQQVHWSLESLADFIQTTGSTQSEELQRLRVRGPEDAAATPAPAPKTLIINNANAATPAHHSRTARKKKKPAPQG